MRPTPLQREKRLQERLMNAFDGKTPVIFEENGRKGVKMDSGELVVPAVYDSIEPEKDYFHCYRYVVVKDGKYGLVDIGTSMILDREWLVLLDVELLFPWEDDWKGNEDVVICQNGTYGIWDWHVRLEPVYDSIRKIRDSSEWLVCKEGKYGVVGIDSRCAPLPCEYDEITLVCYEQEGFINSSFTPSAYYLLRQGDKFGLWTAHGHSMKSPLFLPVVYDEILPPTDDWGLRLIKDGVCGYLDKECNFTPNLFEVPLWWEEYYYYSEAANDRIFRFQIEKMPISH